MSAIYLVATLILALITPAAAQVQQLTLPKTIKVHNNKTGEVIGTVTVSGTTAYIRNKEGEHIATAVRHPNGTTTTFDPNGNVIKRPE